MIIDCDTCAVRGDACGDCVVAVLLGGRPELGPPELDADEQRAIGVLAEAGLVPPLRLVTGEPGKSQHSVTDDTPSVTDDTHPGSTRAV